MSTYHLVLSTVGRLALARNEAERRAMVRAFTRTGGPSLLAFDLVDDHAHSAISSDRPRVLARDLRRAVAKIRPLFLALADKKFQLPTGR